MPPLLDLRDVAFVHAAGRDTFRLEVPALSLAQGGRLALLGPSGSGKSTLLDLLALAAAPDAAGKFAFAPQGAAAHDVAAAWRDDPKLLDRLRARHVGYVMQTGGLLPFLSVRANIDLPRIVSGDKAPSRLDRLAERLGISAHLNKRPHALSVGQRQRAAIARALAHRPALVLADEPTSALDPAMAARVLDLLLSETAAAGAALIVATHDHAAVARLDLPVVAFEVTATSSGARARAVPA